MIYPQLLPWYDYIWNISFSAIYFTKFVITERGKVKKSHEFDQMSIASRNMVAFTHGKRLCG